jgi:hypothetical protein
MKGVSYGLKVVLLMTLAVVGPAAAQDIDLGAGGADQVWNGTRANAHAGRWLDQGAVSAGDNRRDLIIGAPGETGITGQVYVIFGGPVRSGENSLATANVIITGVSTGDLFGQATAAGNILSTEGTMVRNLVVGAPGAFGGRGAVYLFAAGFHEGDRLNTTSAVFTVIGKPGDGLGSALATADLNGDGHREIIMGARQSGHVYAVRGRTSLSGTRDLAVTPADISIFGTGLGNVMAAGDVNGDNLQDLLVGSPSQNTAYLLYTIGGGTFPKSIELPGAADAVFTGKRAGDEAGASIRIGDINGDFKSDVIIGAPGGSGPIDRPQAGETYIIFGGVGITSRSLANADVTFFGAGVGYRTASYSMSGDVNRDSPDDLALLAPGSSDGGQMHIYYGRSRSNIGTLQPDGRRHVDLSHVGQIDRRIIGNASLGAMTIGIVYEVTGEGARDLIVGLPNANGGTGAVYFTISPKMRVSPASITRTLGQGSTATATVTVSNPSPTWITWASSSTVPWASVSPSSGSSNGTTTGSFAVNISTMSLSAGTHTGSVTVASTSRDLEMSLNVPVSVTVTNTQRMAIETPTAGAVLAQPFTVTGWAIDTAAATGTGVNSVLVYAQNGASARTLLGTAAYGSARPSVGSTYGSRFTNSGFSISASGLPGGSYTLIASARSTSTGAYFEQVAGRVTVSVQGSLSKDFNGDGFNDLLWQHQTEGWLMMWTMNGPRRLGSQFLEPDRRTNFNWQIAGIADFNGDTKPDLLWYNIVDGSLEIWMMNGTVRTSIVTPNPGARVDKSWRIVAVADMNADGKADLVWRNMNQGWLECWFMNGSTMLDSVYLNPERITDPLWKIIGAMDVNNDGNQDLIWFHERDGWLIAVLMNGTQMITSVYMDPDRLTDFNWIFAALTDLNGDGKTDIIWQHKTTGTLVGILMDGHRMIDSLYLEPSRVDDLNWKIVGPR